MEPDDPRLVDAADVDGVSTARCRSAGQALHSMMPGVDFVDVRPVGSPDAGDQKTWHAVDGRGHAVAQVSVIEMIDSFVASTLPACRP